MSNRLFPLTLILALNLTACDNEDPGSGVDSSPEDAAVAARAVTTDGPLPDAPVLDKQQSDQLVPDLPPAVDAVLGIALAKSPADRFDSARDLSEAFTEAAAGQLSDHWANQATRLFSQNPWGTQIRA